MTGVGAAQFDLCDISRRTAGEDLLTFLDLQISSNKGNTRVCVCVFEQSEAILKGPNKLIGL